MENWEKRETRGHLQTIRNITIPRSKYLIEAYRRCPWLSKYWENHIIQGEQRDNTWETSTLGGKMVKDTASWEKIEKYLQQGYKCRIKKSKGNKYLSARKGEAEQGLGPFNQELWNRIQNWQLAETQKNNERKLDAASYSISLFSAKIVPTPIERRFTKAEIEEALFEIKLERARIKNRDCIHKLFESCVYWEFLENAENLDKIYEKFGQLFYKYPIGATQLHKENRNKYHINELLCFDCDKFSPRK
jgi:hypothetical protein